MKSLNDFLFTLSEPLDTLFIASGSAGLQLPIVLSIGLLGLLADVDAPAEAPGQLVLRGL